MRDTGALAHLDGLDEESIAGKLDEILLVTDDTWLSEEGVVALTAKMLDGAVFSRRLTESEIERGVIDATLDLGAVDFDAHDGLELFDGAKLECRYPFDGESELDDNGSYVGPPGWMSAFGPAEIVCFHRAGKRLRVEKIDEVGRGESEERARRAAFDCRHVEGVGVEPDELVLDALCHDPLLFRSPVAPVGELLERAGLERRAAWLGLRGEDWEPPGVPYLERERAELRET